MDIITESEFIPKRPKKYISKGMFWELYRTNRLSMLAEH